jgi:hypothetical protein
VARIDLLEGVPGMRALDAWTPDAPELCRQRARATAQHGASLAGGS